MTSPSSSTTTARPDSAARGRPAGVARLTVGAQELEHLALDLVGQAPADWVAPHGDLLMGYLKHEEWWLQNAALTALAPVVYNASIIAGALLLSPSLGIYGVALGVVIGAAGHLLVQLPVLRGRFRYSPIADISDPAARQTFWLMLPRAIGMGANQITFLVNTALASTVAVGAVVSYTVAFSVLQIPLGVIGLPLGIVLLPSMSRALAIGDEAEFGTMVVRALRLLLWIMAFVAAVGIVARDEVVDLLFGWGFDEEALAATAAALGIFLIGLPAHAMNVILARAFYSGKDTITPVTVAILPWLLWNSRSSFTLMSPTPSP